VVVAVVVVVCVVSVVVLVCVTVVVVVDVEALVVVDIDVLRVVLVVVNVDEVVVVRVDVVEVDGHTSHMAGHVARTRAGVRRGAEAPPLQCWGTKKPVPQIAFSGTPWHALGRYVAVVAVVVVVLDGHVHGT